MKQNPGGWSVIRMLDRTIHTICSVVWRVRQSLRLSPDAYLYNCKSVIHVGANSGLERYPYAKYDLEVMWIEPIPEVFDCLVKNIKPHPKQQAVFARSTFGVDL